MNAALAKELGYTHKAKMYGFSGYAQLEDDEHDTFCARFLLTDKIVELLIYVEMFIPFNDNGFKILLGEKL